MANWKWLYFRFKVLPVQVNSINNFNSIYSSGLNTCGTTSDNKTFCWGLGQSGQLGNGSNNNSSTPVQVNTSESFFSNFRISICFFAVNKMEKIFAWGAWKLNGLNQL